MNKFLNAMASMGAEARSEPSWKLYADWCATRASGLREQAKGIAAQFSDIAWQWPYEERKRFSLWLVKQVGWAMERCGASRFEMRHSVGGPGMFAPRDVVEVVVHPTLVEWCSHEPSNPEAHFWLGLYDANGWQSLHEALRLDPAYGPACASIALRNVRAIEYDQHELPSGYLGSPADDLAMLSQTAALLTQAVDPATRDSLSARVATLQKNAEEWIRLKEQLRGLDWDIRLAVWKNRLLK